MILTVGNTKGGTGKTTLAVQLAISLARAGRDVLLVDGDTQGSAQTAIAVRTEAARQPAVACVQFAEGRVLRDQVRLQVPRYQDVLIDAGGRDSSALRAALFLTDVLLVPFRPRSVDVWALADIAALVDEACGVRDGLTALAVLNAATRATTGTILRRSRPSPTSRNWRCWMRRSAAAKRLPCDRAGSVGR